MQRVSVKDLLDAGVHFGHQTKRWNPKVRDFVYGKKNGIHIINLAKTIHQLADACNFLQKVVSEGGTVLFVGTKRQAQEAVKEAALKTGMPYVSERWLGGTLTNNATIQRSISKMSELDKQIAGSVNSHLKKKEVSAMERNAGRLHRNLDGIKDMNGIPKVLIIVDICHDDIAVKEATRLKIPVVAIADTNSNPELVSYPIIANDDAVRSIKIIIDTIAEAIKIATDLYARKVEEDKAQEEIRRKSEPAPEKDEDKSEKDKSKSPVRKKRPVTRRKPEGNYEPKKTDDSAKKADDAKKPATRMKKTKPDEAVKAPVAEEKKAE